jgi:hypothetical protein
MGKVIQGNAMNGVRAKQSVESSSPIVFGKISVYDKSDNITYNTNRDISDYCKVYINDEPLFFYNSLFYKYNRPTSGNKSNILKRTHFLNNLYLSTHQANSVS